MPDYKVVMARTGTVSVTAESETAAMEKVRGLSAHGDVELTWDEGYEVTDAYEDCG